MCSTPSTDVGAVELEWELDGGNKGEEGRAEWKDSTLEESDESPTCGSVLTSNLASKVSKVCCGSVTDRLGSTSFEIRIGSGVSLPSGMVSKGSPLSFDGNALPSVAFLSVSSPALDDSGTSAIAIFGPGKSAKQAGALVRFSFGRHALLRLGTLASSGISTVNPLLNGHGVTSYRRMFGSALFNSATWPLSSSVSLGISMR